MAGGKPADTKPEPTQPEINAWPSKVQLAKELEIPIKRLNNWISRKNVRRGTASDGSDRICRADAEEMLAEQEEQSEEREMQNEAMRVCLEAAKMAQAIASDAQTHILALYKLVPEPSHKLMQMFDEMSARQTERVRHLEATHTELLEVREEFKSAEHERDLARRRFDQQAARRDEIWQGLKKKVGPILARQLVKSGVPLPPDAPVVPGGSAAPPAASEAAQGAPAGVESGPEPSQAPEPSSGGDLPPPSPEELRQIDAVRKLLRTAQLGGQLEMMKVLDGFVTDEQICLIDTILSLAPSPGSSPPAEPPKEPAPDGPGTPEPAT